jgi:hypothetical protein
MIIGFIGAPRTGKTLFMVYHAYQTFIDGAEILSNVTLKEPFIYQKMTPYEMLNIPFTNMDREKKTLLIQEADKWFNARRSMRAENTLLGALTGQSGKRNLSIFWDTQFPHLVDNQLRMITDMVYHCESYIDSRTREPLAFQYTKETPQEEIKLPIIPVTLLEPFFKMYDSYEPTIPLTNSKSMKELDKMYNPDSEEPKIKKKTRRKFYS